MMPLVSTTLTAGSSINGSSSQHPMPPPPLPKIKNKRNIGGNPDPDATVIALSPRTLMDSNRFICEICNKGFSREQNLQMHYKGHNRPWKLKTEKVKKAYVCPDEACVHHHPSRALCDLSAIKKHYSRKHGERQWKCKTCPKAYAVQGDLKAHAKICGTTTYKCCHCGATLSRKDSFANHKKICDDIAAKNAINPPQESNSSQFPLHLFMQNHPGNTFNYPPIPNFQISLPTPPILYQDIPLPQHIPLYTPLPQQPLQTFNSIPDPVHHFSSTSPFPHAENYTESTFNPVTNMPATNFPSDAFTFGDFPPFQPDCNLPGAAFDVSGGTVGDCAGSLDLTGLPPLPDSLEISSMLDEDSNLNFMGGFPSWPH